MKEERIQKGTDSKAQNVPSSLQLPREYRAKLAKKTSHGQEVKNNSNGRRENE